MESIKGRVITGGDVQGDGMHIFLDDGRIIVVAGLFAAAVCEIDKSQVN